GDSGDDDPERDDPLRLGGRHSAAGVPAILEPVVDRSPLRAGAGRSIGGARLRRGRPEAHPRIEGGRRAGGHRHNPEGRPRRQPLPAACGKTQRMARRDQLGVQTAARQTRVLRRRCYPQRLGRSVPAERGRRGRSGKRGASHIGKTLAPVSVETGLKPGADSRLQARSPARSVQSDVRGRSDDKTIEGVQWGGDEGISEEQSVSGSYSSGEQGIGIDRGSKNRKAGEQRQHHGGSGGKETDRQSEQQDSLWLRPYCQKRRADGGTFIRKTTVSRSSSAGAIEGGKR